MRVSVGTVARCVVVAPRAVTISARTFFGSSADSAVETKPSSEKLRFEDMVAKAQQSAVLILVY